MPCRLLILAPTGFYADYGCHVRIRGHAEALQARGHEVLLYTYPYGRDVPELTTVRPGLWPRRPEFSVGASWRKLALDMTLWPGLWRAAKRFRPHVVHAYLHEGALLGVWIARRLGVPLVFDYQGSLAEELLAHGFVRRSSPLLPFWRGLERWIDSLPQIILTSSRAAAQRLHTGNHTCTCVQHLPDSVDPERFRPAMDRDEARLRALRQPLGLAADRPIIVYLGLLAPYQGIDVLLHAAAQYRERAEVAPQYLIMGFPHVDRYQRLAMELGLAQDVCFTGRIAYAEAPDYLALGDLAVAPKLRTSEGSGKVLTYMAMALPVVASETPVHREYLADDSFYAASGDARALAAAIRRALHDPERTERGLRLHQRVASRYTWQHAALQIEGAYAQSGVAADRLVAPKLAML